VVAVATDLGLELLGASDSPLVGAKKGNVEIFVHLRGAEKTSE
jgi:hypothetical protein